MGILLTHSSDPARLFPIYCVVNSSVYTIPATEKKQHIINALTGNWDTTSNLVCLKRGGDIQFLLLLCGVYYYKTLQTNADKISMNSSQWACWLTG